MNKIKVLLLLFALLPACLSADWLEQVNAIQTEIKNLTKNEQNLSDEQRLKRFYQLSYDLTILENPGFATFLGDPREQSRLTDNSTQSIDRRRASERDALALLNSLDRETLPEQEWVNYDLLRQRLENDVRAQRFPGHYLQMNQMGGPQQDLARLLAMMPNTSVPQLENQIARMEALPAYIDQSIALMRQGLEAGVTPARITLRDVPNQVRSQLVDDASASPLLKGFNTIPASVYPLQAESLRGRAAAIYREQVVPAYERLLEFTED